MRQAPHLTPREGPRLRTFLQASVPRQDSEGPPGWDPTGTFETFQRGSPIGGGVPRLRSLRGTLQVRHSWKGSSLRPSPMPLVEATPTGALEGDWAGGRERSPYKHKRTRRGHEPSKRPAILEAGFRQEPRRWSDEEVKAKALVEPGEGTHYTNTGISWVLTR